MIESSAMEKDEAVHVHCTVLKPRHTIRMKALQRSKKINAWAVQYLNNMSSTVSESGTKQTVLCQGSLSALRLKCSATCLGKAVQTKK